MLQKVRCRCDNSVGNGGKAEGLEEHCDCSVRRAGCKFRIRENLEGYLRDCISELAKILELGSHLAYVLPSFTVMTIFGSEKRYCII